MPSGDMNPVNTGRSMSDAGSTINLGSSNSHQDGILLDFLYPPPTLAWLRRSDRSCRDRWEKRNARRLPQGLVQASRGYTWRPCRSPQKDKRTEQRMSTGTGKRSDKRTDHQKEVVGAGSEEDNGTNHASVPHEVGYERLLDATPSQARSSFPANDLPIDGQPQTAMINGWKDTVYPDPQNASHDPMNRRQELLRLLALPLQTQRASQKAWRLYNELYEEDKEDLRLKTELLVWMSKSKSKIADAHCISLYWSIPLPARSLVIYEAVLSAILRRQEYNFATSLQKEALANIDNGHSVSTALFAYAIKRERWDLAVNVMDYHMEALDGSDDMRFQELFWINVPNIPHLARRSANLSRWVLRRQQEGDDVTNFKSLAIKLAYEAVLQYLQDIYPGIPKEATPKDVELLFRYAHSSGELSSRFLESSLTSMLENPLTRFQNERIRKLVSLLYVLYKQSRKIKPTEKILMRLLEQTTAHAARAREISDAGSNVTLNEIVDDWKQFHGKLSVEAINRLLSHYSYMGNVVKVREFYDYLVASYLNPEDHRHALSSLIYVHARRADLKAAKKAFDGVLRTATEYGQQLGISCWNNLLYAHARVDDVAGALLTFKELLDRNEPRPTALSFQPILEMLASRGDIDGIAKCFNTFDRVMAAEQRPLAFTATMMTALLNRGEIKEAEGELQKAVARVRDGADRGSLTPHFNVLITAHALRRDATMVMQTYQWMKEESVRFDSLTYASLLQALTLTRRTEMAYRILTSTMPDQNIDATAFHYAIVMAGFHRQRQYNRALHVHKLMIRANIRESLSSRRALLMARMMLEDQKTPVQSETHSTAPLEEVQRAMREAIQAYDVEVASPKEPLLGLARRDINDGLSLYITPLIFFYGRRRCFEALQDLVHQYKTLSRPDEGGAVTPPLGLLSAFMASHLSAKKFAEVEACWLLVKEQAEMEVTLPTIPDLRPGQDVNSDGVTSGPSHGLTSDSKFVRREHDADPGTGVTTEKATRANRKRKTPTSTRLSPTQRHILSGPLRIYLAALAGQSRYDDAVKIVAKLLGQGWTLGHHTWNAFIRMLCRSSPPLALSAFTFTERFLMPQFPGWTRSKHRDSSTKGLEHINIRDLRRDQVLPQYSTMVHLGFAFLDLRRQEITSGQNRELHVPKELARMVGDVRTIRERAPKTLFAIQSMPKVNDDLQNRLLHPGVE